ncbi:MAG: hypothetical protein E4H36_11900 [Spirochaetales bacterium]|nr:MAG: hypothetical protein E4H36_11900 [Spirochaetales bacterium]
MKFKTCARLVFITLLFCGSAPICFSENRMLQLWYKEDKKAAKYENLRSDLGIIFNQAEREGIPPLLLVEKLKEGSAKHAAPAKLFDAMKAELEKLTAARLLVSQACPDPGDSEETLSLIRGISIFLRGGLKEAELLRFLRLSCADSAARSRFLSLGSAMLSILSIDELSADQRIALGESLMESGIPESGFRTVASLFLKGKVNRIDTGDVLAIVTANLVPGRGIIRMEEELNRRTQKK